MERKYRVRVQGYWMRAGAALWSAVVVIASLFIGMLCLYNPAKPKGEQTEPIIHTHAQAHMQQTHIIPVHILQLPAYSPYIYHQDSMLNPE